LHIVFKHLQALIYSLNSLQFAYKNSYEAKAFGRKKNIKNFTTAGLPAQAPAIAEMFATMLALARTPSTGEITSNRKDASNF
jgi:hypothetical protein